MRCLQTLEDLKANLVMTVWCVLHLILFLLQFEEEELEEGDEEVGGTTFFDINASSYLG